MSVLIVAYAFGTGAEIWSNKTISATTVQLARAHNAFVFTQKPFIKLPPDIRAAYVKETEAKPAPTLIIAKQSVPHILAQKCSKVLLLAARPHLPRAGRDQALAHWDAGIDVPIEIPDEILRYSYDSWFCSDSTQARTQSREQWEKRETFALRLPIPLYRLVTWGAQFA